MADKKHTATFYAQGEPVWGYGRNPETGEKDLSSIKGLYPPKRRAWVPLDYRALHAVLNLPEGMRVVGVESDIDPVRVRVLVESDRLADVEPNAESPMLWPRVRYTDESSPPVIDWDATLAPSSGREH